MIQYFLCQLANDLIELVLKRPGAPSVWVAYVWGLRIACAEDVSLQFSACLQEGLIRAYAEGALLAPTSLGFYSN